MKDKQLGGVFARIGVVAIGRNEGERLRRCLDSVVREVVWKVYVDSGSTDASVATACAKRVVVLQLDMNIPFTAARARNEGYRHLRDLAPHLAYVQFVDGDCELSEYWLKRAANYLDEHQSVAAVFGRLREKYPTQSIYNMLCDIEWDSPIGESKSCGGIAMIRAGAFESVHGYRADLIAGEEPELCVRLRANGWKIWRLDEEMALHDAAMSTFAQWWTRAMRAGYAYAQGASLHGASSERHFVRESRSAWFWGLGMPLLVFVGAALAGPVGLMAFAVYPIQVVRLALTGNRPVSENWWRAVFLVIGKFPEMLGQMKFVSQRFLGRESHLIEYK